MTETRFSPPPDDRRRQQAHLPIAFDAALAAAASLPEHNR